jgi:hypothetical protein
MIHKNGKLFVVCPHCKVLVGLEETCECGWKFGEEELDADDADYADKPEALGLNPKI